MLELRTSEFECQWRETNEILTTYRKVSELTKETKEVRKSISEVSSQVTEIRTQGGDSLSASKAACDNFKQFTRVIEVGS